MAPLKCRCSCGAHSATLPAHVTEPSFISICHCKLCQHRTGSAFFIPAVFAGGDPTWLGLDAEPQNPQHTGTVPQTPTEVNKCKPYFLATINDTKGTPISYNTWRGEVSGSVNRAFCAQCGDTIAIWKITTASGDPQPENERFLLIPAPNLSPSFDWTAAVTKEEYANRVFNTWTSSACGVWPLELPGAVNFARAPGI